jgi:CTP:phosphocholine cytidylyltransferase-like protein
MKTVFMLAAGSGTRWKDYRGTPKHKVMVEGEVLIERTYRQFSQYTDNIVIVANEEQNLGQTYIPPKDENWKDIAKFWSSNDIWSDDQNVMVFADVYFTDEAVKSIMEDTHTLSFYLRSKASKLTKKPWGEIWGIGFDGLSMEVLKSTMLKIIESKVEYKTGGWKLFDQLTKDEQIINVVEIDDWTEDFDWPSDILMWEKQRNEFLSNNTSY